MGIIDFREIVSPKADHASGTLAPLGKSNLRDDFELFCQEFFTTVRGDRIFKSVSRGPDGGIDLGVEETLPDGSALNWLVSCKHHAHSDKAVSDREENNVIERVLSWDCDGFIPFYTTVPTANVSMSLVAVEKLGKRVERYYRDRIERELVSSPCGIQLAARYFPKSMVNHYTRIIETAGVYDESDMIVDGDMLYDPHGIQRWLPNASQEVWARAKKEMAHQANLLATMNCMRPIFSMRSMTPSS